jgi:hypothetical protein
MIDGLKTRVSYTSHPDATIPPCRLVATGLHAGSLWWWVLHQKVITIESKVTMIEWKVTATAAMSMTFVADRIPHAAPGPSGGPRY